MKVQSKICKVYIPNAFTPNGDGNNDFFRIPPIEKMNLIGLSIFDRWGKEIFHTSKQIESWDGNFKGKPSPPAAYIYLIDGIVNNKKIQLKGVINLVR